MISRRNKVNLERTHLPLLIPLLLLVTLPLHRAVPSIVVHHIQCQCIHAVVVVTHVPHRLVGAALVLLLDSFLCKIKFNCCR